MEDSSQWFSLHELWSDEFSRFPGSRREILGDFLLIVPPPPFEGTLGCGALNLNRSRFRALCLSEGFPFSFDHPLE